MEESENKVSGAAGGLTSVLRGVGWLVFAILTGRRFSTNKIGPGFKLVVGSIVLSALVGAVIGSYEVPYPRNPFGFRADPLAYFIWDDGDAVSGAVGGGFAGLAFGLFLLFLTEGTARKAAREKVEEQIEKMRKKKDNS